jgi:hypothetical protein
VAALHNVRTYLGNGQSGVWSDPLNWTNGLVPGAADTALITRSAVLNGPIEVGTLMLLGTETITIDGAVKTDSTNTCESFMVCDQATANFQPGSSLIDAGGFEVGVDAVGTASIAGAAGTAAAANVNVAVMKIGQFAPGVGTLNVAGGMTDAGGAYVGLYGHGTLNVTGTGQAHFLSGLVVGAHSGAVGVLNLSGSAVVDANLVAIGTSVAGAPGGTGTANIAGQATLSCGEGVVVCDGSAVVLNGGNLVAGSQGNGVQIATGASVSGVGAVTSAAHGVRVDGVLAVAGGTLVVTGNLSGMGAVQIGAGATLDLVASRINLPGIAFLGSSGTLELTAGVAGAFAIDGFGSGDRIVMAGIDQANWNSANHVLSLSEHGQVMDKLTLPGVAADAVFQVTPGNSGSVIALLPDMVGVQHH